MSRRAFRERCGKARRARHQRRASLVLTRQSIDEFLDPESDSAVCRLNTIPVIRRGELHPTAEPAPAAGEAARQLQLPYGRPAEMVAEAPSRLAPDRRELLTAARGAHSPAAGRASQAFRVSAGRRSPSFSWGRFAYGLLVGSAAAGVALLLMRWAIG